MSAIAPPSPRLAFIDNLRWSAISMVVVLHTAVTYSGFGRWYYRDRVDLSLAAKVAFATYQSFHHAVAMGLLFGIAGFFAAQGVTRKGGAWFMRERLFRLGLPLVIYLFVVGPLTECFVTENWGAKAEASFFEAWQRHLLNGSLFGGSGPLWFCMVLLVFCAVLVVLRRFVPFGRAAFASPPRVWQVLGTAVVMALLAFLVGVVAPSGAVVLNVDFHDLPQYPLMFAAGVMAWRFDWPACISAAAGRRWLVGGILASAVIWALLIWQGGALTGRLRDYYGGWHWQAAGMDLWRAVTCVSVGLGLVVLYRDRFDRRGRVAGFLTRNAFGVYVFHAPVLIAVTRALHGWEVMPGVKFAVASALSVGLSFLFVGVVVRRVPGLRAIV